MLTQNLIWMQRSWFFLLQKYPTNYIPTEFLTFFENIQIPIMTKVCESLKLNQTKILVFKFGLKTSVPTIPKAPLKTCPCIRSNNSISCNSPDCLKAFHSLLCQFSKAPILNKIGVRATIQCLLNSFYTIHLTTPNMYWYLIRACISQLQE